MPNKQVSSIPASFHYGRRPWLLRALMEGPASGVEANREFMARLSAAFVNAHGPRADVPAPQDAAPAASPPGLVTAVDLGTVTVAPLPAAETDASQIETKKPDKPKPPKPNPPETGNGNGGIGGPPATSPGQGNGSGNPPPVTPPPVTTPVTPPPVTTPVTPPPATDVDDPLAELTEKVQDFLKQHGMETTWTAQWLMAMLHAAQGQPAPPPKWPSPAIPPATQLGELFRKLTDTVTELVHERGVAKSPITQAALSVLRAAHTHSRR